MKQFIFMIATVLLSVAGGVGAAFFVLASERANAPLPRKQAPAIPVVGDSRKLGPEPHQPPTLSGDVKDLNQRLNRIERQWKNHNRSLYQWGIAKDFNLTIKASPTGSAQVVVGPGIAFDREGRLLFCTENREFDLKPWERAGVAFVI